MNYVHYAKTYSAANIISSGSSSLLFGPFPIDHLGNFALFIYNSGTSTINMRVRTSYDQAREIEDDFPLGSFTNTQAVSVNPGKTVVRTMYGDSNPFKYITILGSSTATIGSSLTSMYLTGRSNK